MPLENLQVGTLKVRVPYQYDKQPSGIFLPLLFKGGCAAFTDFKELLDQGKVIFPHAAGFLTVDGIPYTARNNEQLQAEDYKRVCQRLDRSDAGRRARDLLFDHLTPQQRRDAEQKRYFEFCLLNSERVEECLDQEIPFKIARFRIYRGFPNGNVLLGTKPNKFKYRFCFHPLQPYPTDDICLGQMTLIYQNPDQFVSEANASKVTPQDTYNMTPHHQARQFNALFARRSQKKLTLPFIRERIG